MWYLAVVVMRIVDGFFVVSLVKLFSKQMNGRWTRWNERRYHRFKRCRPRHYNMFDSYVSMKFSLSYRYTECIKRLGWCETTTSSFKTHKEIIAHCSSETKRGIWSRDVIFLTGCIKSCQNIPVQRETKHRSSLSILRLGCCPYPFWWVWQYQATSKSVPPCVSALQVNARQATFCDDQSSHIPTTSF